MSSTISPADIPHEVAVKRSDPIYNAHSYLTKVPVAAIEPFILAFSKPGDIVLDSFAGSGMTGVAAAMLDRRAVLRDISVLGRHIGTNYVSIVDPRQLRAEAARVIRVARERIGAIYAHRCEACRGIGELSRTTWSVVIECRDCGGRINYYDALQAAEWSKRKMKCPGCDTTLVLRGSARVDEQPVLDTIACSCSRLLRDQQPTEPLQEVSLEGLLCPDIPIGADRQMFYASALGKHGLVTTASFFSRRNLAALTALRDAILETQHAKLRSKLMFAFTAILARGSKRYQWSRKRPLNAANQHYYIAPVFLEWNPFDLFERKIEAVVRSDGYLRERMQDHGAEIIDVDYQISSADALDLANESVDYVFIDPPFGSNIFYSDMSLFQEAWLGEFTNHDEEAVVDRSSNGKARRTAERYERLITDALRECHRVLKPGGWLSLVFSNSSGDVWALVQRAVLASGLELDSDGITILSKGQRSVKGLASGFENIVTVDLVLTMQKVPAPDAALLTPSPGFLSTAVDLSLARGEAKTPSHVYASVVREYLRRHYRIADLSVSTVVDALRRRGYTIDASSGVLRRVA